MKTNYCRCEIPSTTFENTDFCYECGKPVIYTENKMVSIKCSTIGQLNEIVNKSK